MSNESFREEYDVLVDELYHILNSKEIVPELQNENVVIQLLKSIKICEFLEDKLEVPQDDRKSYGFLKILSQSYAISNIHVDSYYFIDETTLNDDVNYLKIFSKNLLGKNYKDLTPRTTTQNANQSSNVHKAKFDTNVSDTNNNTNNTDSSNYDYVNQNNNNGLYGAGNNFFSSMFGAGYGGFNGGFMGGNPEDQMAMQAASNRMTQEIQSGRLFVYDSKPKYIPILKYTIAVFILFLVAVIIIEAILAQIANGISIPENSELWSYLGMDSYIKLYHTLTGTTLNPNDITIGTISGFSTGWVWLFVVIFAGLFSYQAYILLRTPRSENEKYKVQVGWLIFDIVITLFYFIYSFASASVVRYMFADWSAFAVTYKAYASGAHLGLMTATYAFSIFYITLLCVLILTCLTTWLIKPKQNVEFLNNTFQKYYEEAKEQFDESFRR